jgi:hypothetical protein
MRIINRTGKTHKTAEMILEWLRADPTRLKWTSAAIAKEFHCSVGFVHKVKRIYDPNLPTRTYTSRKPLTRRARKTAFTPPPLAEPTAPEVAAIVEDQTMTTDDKRTFLKKLAENPEVRDEAKISAIRTLHMIDESAGKSKELGPGKPLTFEDTVHRLYLLITACGPDVAREAVRLAKKEWEIAGSLKAPKSDEAAPAS